MAYAISQAVVHQRRNARLRHGAQSQAHLAPLIVSTRKSLLARMGMRQRDLSWSGRELLEAYCCSKAKVIAVDQWLEVNPLTTQAGTRLP